MNIYEHVNPADLADLPGDVREDLADLDSTPHIGFAYALLDRELDDDVLN